MGDTFDRLAADALADEVAVLVRRQLLDARSPAADALLDYRNPPSSPRADRLAAAERTAADLATVAEQLAEARAVCLCGCDEHESYGEEGEDCGVEGHECIRVAISVRTLVLALRERVAAAVRVLEEPAWLIWCTRDQCWWKADSCGYTSDIALAGRYTADEAYGLCRLRSSEPWGPPELMVPSPEWLAARAAILSGAW